MRRGRCPELGSMSVPVSVVMPVYNGRKFLLAQVESILSQLEAQDELVVIDDASTDYSVELLKSLNAPQIKIYQNTQNEGVIRSFERGFQLAREEIIFLCDQDDVWLPGKRSAFVEQFENNRSILVVISDAEVIDGEGSIIAHSFMAVRHGFKGGVIATLWRNRYLGCAMAVRRSLLRIALPIPHNVPMQDMWLGVLGQLQGEVAYLKTPYLQYRRHKENSTPLYSQFRWRNMIRWRVGLLTALLQRLWVSRSRSHWDV
jgi:glycosyltransferase involved in cell wall biosynthesis